MNIINNNKSCVSTFLYRMSIECVFLSSFFSKNLNIIQKYEFNIIDEKGCILRNHLATRHCFD